MKQDQRGLYYVQGIPVPETPKPRRELEPWGKTEVVGKGLPRVDAYERVSGTAVYPSDVTFPDMLYSAVLRCPHPHARVVSIDATAASGTPGVHAVISSATQEANVDWSYTRDQLEIPVKLFDTLCRFEGEPVAAVAAETPYQAWDAVHAIKVTYEVLPFVADEEKALLPAAPKIHADGNKVKSERYVRGDLSRGFGEADVVVEQTYATACELHTPMELHGCVAKWDGDRLTLWESTQGVFAVQARVAKVLGLPLSKVRVIGHYMGGGFGSKLRAGKYTVIAALLARRTARPVKLFLSREETLLATGNRPPAAMKLKAAAKKDGTLTALEFSALATGGAYPAGGTVLLDWQVRDLYLCPHVSCETTDVYINAGPARPFRAPGHPQCSWALEQTLDALAEAMGMDPVELRLRNVPTVSQARKGSPPYTSTGLRECLIEGARAFGWRELRLKYSNEKQGAVRRGVGMAACLWYAGGGGPPSTVIVRLFSDGSVNLNMGASDIGTGTKTVMALVVAEELGVKPALIEVEHADTATTQYATPSGGSKTVPTEAPAVRAAAVSVKEQLIRMAAEDLRADPDTLVLRGETVLSTLDGAKRVRITDITGLKKRGVIVGVGYRGPNPEDKVINPFGAQFCEVEVDTRTGECRIVRFLAVHDSGRVMDRLTFDSQVIGGITMGIGLAMTEARVLDRNQTGKLVNRNWHDYKIPTALDVPSDILSIPIEIRDTEANSTGAKGLGEPVTIPTAAAIANAVRHATGIRPASSPLDPVHLGVLLAQQRKGGLR